MKSITDSEEKASVEDLRKKLVERMLHDTTNWVVANEYTYKDECPVMIVGMGATDTHMSAPRNRVAVYPIGTVGEEPPKGLRIALPGKTGDTLATLPSDLRDYEGTSKLISTYISYCNEHLKKIQSHKEELLRDNLAMVIPGEFEKILGSKT